MENICQTNGAETAKDEKGVVKIDRKGEVPKMQLNHLKEAGRYKIASVEEMLQTANATLSKTMEEVGRVIAMIQHFREASALQIIKQEKRRGTTSVHDSVFQVIRAMQYEFPFQNITILKILPHDLPPIPIEREHLESIFFHLLYHARQVLQGGKGIITIEAGEKVYDSPENEKQRRFMIRVTDTGSGVKQEELPHLFDPFFTFDDFNSGKGFGLYIVKNLVELYQGSIRVETSSQGTSFFVEIPA